MTLDYELDYGGRTQELKTLEQRSGHLQLRSILDQLEVPLSAFVQTGILEKSPKALEVAKFIGNEFHSHSHTHASKHFDSDDEFKTSLEILRQKFDQTEFGYRAPFGKLYPGDHEKLMKMGYQFDASVFPSFRPGKFNNLTQTIHPHRLPCGLLEIPFGVFPHARIILGISYMKLFGPSFYHFLENLVGLPRIVVCYAHMHDFFPTQAVRTFPTGVKMAFSRNKHKGLDIARDFLSHLKQKGYQFLSMNELAQKLKEEGT